MVTYDNLLNGYKWTLEVFYLLIAIGAVYQIVTRREDKLKSRKPRYIYLLILVAVTSIDARYIITYSSSWYFNCDSSADLC